jgi:prepilin-type N-terminal cleavage/methylation domain-containing protein/prepilin-type processing-associated H-X9-DG protein
MAGQSNFMANRTNGMTNAPKCEPGSSTGSNAFTLLELLMVVAIIGILAALLFPVFSRARAYSYSTTCKNHLRQMGVALKMYVEEHRNTYPYYLGPPGPTYGDAVFPGDSRGKGKGCVFWSSKLFPYYSLNWTNPAFHCPGYKGAIGGPIDARDGAVARLGSYGYNVNGTGTHDYTKYYFGLGPVITWQIAAVSEAQVKVPSEMLAMGDSQYLVGAGGDPGGYDGLFVSQHLFDPVRHGKTYNQLWCDGHVGAMDPSVLFNPTNSASLWNCDHEPHPESWPY